MRRIRVSLHRDEALRATRVTIGKKKLVYVLIADKRLQYKGGKSRIAYIGTTKGGLARISGSVSERADAILSLRGVRSFHARVVTCKPRRNVRTWRKLERALILKFKELFDDVPKCNIHGKNMKAKDEDNYFHSSGLKGLVDELS